MQHAQLQIIVVCAGAPHVVAWVSRAWLAAFGYQRHRIVGHPVATLFGEQTCARDVDRLRAGALAGCQGVFSIVCYTQFRIPVRARVCAVALRDANRGATLIRIVTDSVRPIDHGVASRKTTRPAASHPTAQRTESLGHCTDALPGRPPPLQPRDIVCVVTQAHSPYRIMWVSASWLSLTQYAAFDVIGREGLECIQGPETNRITVSTLMDHIRRLAPVFNLPLHNYSHFGVGFTHHVTVLPFVNVADDCTYFIATSRNINNHTPVITAAAVLTQQVHDCWESSAAEHLYASWAAWFAQEKRVFSRTPTRHVALRIEARRPCQPAAPNAPALAIGALRGSMDASSPLDACSLLARCVGASSPLDACRWFRLCIPLGNLGRSATRSG